jgi:hypothetical protein
MIAPHSGRSAWASSDNASSLLTVCRSDLVISHMAKTRAHTGKAPIKASRLLVPLRSAIRPKTEPNLIQRSSSGNPALIRFVTTELLIPYSLWSLAGGRQIGKPRTKQSMIALFVRRNGLPIACSITVQVKTEQTHSAGAKLNNLTHLVNHDRRPTGALAIRKALKYGRFSCMRKIF